MSGTGGSVVVVVVVVVRAAAAHRSLLTVPVDTKTQTSRSRPAAPRPGLGPLAAAPPSTVAAARATSVVSCAERVWSDTDEAP